MQNPKYFGPILIMILFVAASTGFIYVLINKTYVEQTVPTADQRDAWTENAILWTPIIGETPIENFNDYVNGSYFSGNRSIEFSSINNTQISMQLDDIGPVNCSGPDGFTGLTLRIKWTSPSAEPENATMYLFSESVSDYFYYNLTENFNFTSNAWNNLTIPLVTNWSNNGTAAIWSNITGVKLEFGWLQTSNITLLVDGLFFRGVFKLSVENITNSVFSFSLFSFMQFFLRWVILSGLIYILTKTLFKTAIVWRTLLILVGFALLPMLIQAIVSVATYSTLPTLHYPLEFFSGISTENEIAYNMITQQTWTVIQVNRYMEILTLLWIIILDTFATRLLTTFSWTKSILIAMIAYFVAVFAQGILLGV
jgi:hypothetical protein